MVYIGGRGGGWEQLERTLKKILEKMENSYWKMKRSPEERHTQTHKNLFEYFDDHRCLSQSEESKFMWIQSKGHGAIFVQI